MKITLSNRAGEVVIDFTVTGQTIGENTFGFKEDQCVIMKEHHTNGSSTDRRLPQTIAQKMFDAALKSDMYNAECDGKVVDPKKGLKLEPRQQQTA